MSSIPRPSLEESARRWLESAPRDPTLEGVRSSLTDFVGKRFRGAADQLRAVHDLRLRMIGDERPLTDLSPARRGPWDDQTLGEAASASAPSDQGRLLFHLVRDLAPAKVVEMGTNIGISAAYVALGLRFGEGGQLTSIEASGVRLQLARDILRELGIQDVDLVEGYFDETLPSVLERLGKVSMAFVDGNHRLQPTLSYFEQLRAHMPSGGVVILDDIRWSEDMLEAWNRIRAASGVASAVDLGRTGLVMLA